MVTKQDICKKIEEINPTAGVCGVDLDVEFDERTDSWAVIMYQGQSKLKTFIQSDEVTKCLEGHSCDRLSMKVAHMRRVERPALF